MVTPTFAASVALLFNLCERLWPHPSARPHQGPPFGYEHKALLGFFLVMHQRRTLRFKAQHRWLHQHADLRQVFGLPEVPDRPTLARRSKDLYPVLQALGTLYHSVPSL